MTELTINVEEYTQENLSFEEKLRISLKKRLEIHRNHIEIVTEKDAIIRLQRLEIKRLRGINCDQVKLSDSLVKELGIIKELFDQIVGEE